MLSKKNKKVSCIMKICLKLTSSVPNRVEEERLTAVASVCSSHGEGWSSGGRSSPSSQKNKHILCLQN